MPEKFEETLGEIIKVKKREDGENMCVVSINICGVDDGVQKLMTYYIDISGTIKGSE